MSSNFDDDNYVPPPLPDPTPEGKRRYSRGEYNGLPCTCTEQCDNPCRGQTCGCHACSTAFADFMSPDRM